MKSLHKLQTDFAAAIRFKDIKATQELPINETNNITKETRLEVYSYAFWKRIGRSLKDDFSRVHEMLGETSDSVLREFISKAKPGFHLLGDVSVAYCDFIIKFKPELKYLAQLDLAVLVAEMSAWHYELKEKENFLLLPQQLGDYSSESINLLWNSSLQIIDTTLVFQKNDDALLTQASDTILKLLIHRTSLTNLSALIDKMEELSFSEKDANESIAFLTANDLLFFWTQS